MIVLALYETPEELEKLKQRANDGETIYTVINDQTVLLLDKNEMRNAGKREVGNLVARFHFKEAEAQTKTEIEAENTPYGVTTQATPNEREQFDKYYALCKRVDTVEETLRRCHLQEV